MEMNERLVLIVVLLLTKGFVPKVESKWVQSNGSSVGSYLRAKRNGLLDNLEFEALRVRVRVVLGGWSGKHE